MYVTEERIRFSETDYRNKLSTFGIVNYFQDCNTLHAESLGYTTEYHRQLGHAWVLSAWQIVINRKPALGEAVRVATWPYDFKGFMGKRNYTMDTMQGERLVCAGAIWTMIDLEKGLPTRITEPELEHYELEEKLDMDYAPRKIALSGEGLRKDGIWIGRERLDTNYHMNNAQYIALAEEYLPEDMQIRQVRVEYKKEVKYATVLVPVVYEEENRICVSLESGEGVCHAVVEFAK